MGLYRQAQVKGYFTIRCSIFWFILFLFFKEKLPLPYVEGGKKCVTMFWSMTELSDLAVGLFPSTLPI